jgi:hypothetical protein
MVQFQVIAGMYLGPRHQRDSLCSRLVQQERCHVTTSAREFIDYWIENSVHASEAQGAVGAEQDVAILTSRCVEMASTLGLSRAALDQEVGNLATYIGTKLGAANRLERGRRA